jgi:hypothetical protein
LGGIEEFFYKNCPLLINVCVGERQESFEEGTSSPLQL